MCGVGRGFVVEACLAHVALFGYRRVRTPPNLEVEKNKIDRIVSDESERFNLKLSENPINLSPDGLRKLTIASILAIDTDIIIFDEPTKFTAKLRQYKTDKNLLLLKCELEDAGHGGKSGRDSAIEEIAFDYSFIFKITNNLNT